MSEYKIALFGSGGKLILPRLLLEECLLMVWGKRGWKVEFDGTICVAYVDGTI